MDEVRSGQDLVNNGLVDCALGTHGTILVILLLTVGEVANRSVNEHVSWAGVEVIAPLHFTLGEDGEVGDAANVLDGTVERGMVQQERIKSCKERAALAAKCHVRHAEVAKGCDAGVGRNDGDFRHVQVGTHLVPLKELGKGQMQMV